MRVGSICNTPYLPFVVLITNNHTSSSSSSRVAVVVAVWWEVFVAVAHVLGNVRREETAVGVNRRQAYGIKGDDPKNGTRARRHTPRRKAQSSCAYAATPRFVTPHCVVADSVWNLDLYQTSKERFASFVRSLRYGTPW